MREEIKRWGQISFWCFVQIFAIIDYTAIVLSYE